MCDRAGGWTISKRDTRTPSNSEGLTGLHDLDKKEGASSAPPGSQISRVMNVVGQVVHQTPRLCIVMRRISGYSSVLRTTWE